MVLDKKLGLSIEKLGFSPMYQVSFENIGLSIEKHGFSNHLAFRESMFSVEKPALQKQVFIINTV